MPHGVACKGRCIPAVPYFVNLAGFQIKALQHFHCFLPCNVLFFNDILLVEGPHVLVKAAKAAGRRTNLYIKIHVNKPYRLKGLIKGLRGIFWNDPAVFCNQKQLLLSRFVRAVLCHSLGFLCHSARIGNQAFALNNACLPKIDPCLVLHALRNHAVDVMLTFFHVASDSYCQNFFVVAGRLAGNAILQTDAKNIVVFQLADVRGKSCLGQVLHGLALPVFEGFQNNFPVLRGNIIRVLAPCLEFIDVTDIPGARLKLGVQVCASVCIRRRAHNQLIVHNERGHVLHNVIDDPGSENRNSIAGELLIGFRCQDQTLCCDSWNRIKILFFYPAYSRC